MLSAAVLRAVEVIYVSKQTISRIYLLDTAIDRLSPRVDGLSRESLMPVRGGSGNSSGTAGAVLPGMRGPTERRSSTGRLQVTNRRISHARSADRSKQLF